MSHGSLRKQLHLRSVLMIAVLCQKVVHPNLFTQTLAKSLRNFRHGQLGYRAPRLSGLHSSTIKVSFSGKAVLGQPSLKSQLLNRTASFRHRRPIPSKASSP